jgi:hypothetical protein
MSQDEAFVKHLVSLAPEGETFLFVRQTPRRASDGTIELHADGAIKATWPAFLPRERKRAGGEAWYGNTASFIVERFPERRVSAAAANCEYVLVMVLDDIGTKSQTPPLAPTWRMETSEGNEQWGYVFSEQPTKGEFAAAIRAIAAAGFTDPGACNPVRNFRLPGSVNLKPDRDGFASRLVEFDPSREFTLSQICEALGVTPGEPDGDGPRPIRIEDDGKDDVFGWLAQQGMVYSAPNAEGWAGVLCPNHAQHSDGSPEGRYRPATRSYCCLHGHCLDWDSERFLNWVAEQGGPRQSTGLREELVSARMAQALADVAPTPELDARAAQVIAAVERREVGRLEKAEWFERFAYVLMDDSYFDLVERKQLTRRNFDALFRHVQCHSVHANANGNARRVEASTFFDENRQSAGARVLTGVTYAAGEGPLVSLDGAVQGNLWRNGRPDLSGAASDDDVRLWLDHAARLIPDEVERNIVFDFMAHRVQFPSVKVNWGVLHGGNPGSGKDSLWAPLKYAIGGASHANIATVQNDQIASEWGYSYMSELVVLNELRMPEASDRRALENRLKPLLAAPPETLNVNRKHQAPVNILNRLACICFSNERVAITLPSDDRRWFVIWSDAAIMSTESAERLWNWYQRGGGFAAIGRWLRSRDVSAFRPGAAPIMTDAKLGLLQAGMSHSESAIVELARTKTGPFRAGVVCGPWQITCEALSGYMSNGVRPSVSTLLHALREAGWIDGGMVKSRTYPMKKHLIASPELYSVEDKSTLRKMWEDHLRGKTGPDLKVVE